MKTLCMNAAVLIWLVSQVIFAQSAGPIPLNAELKNVGSGPISNIIVVNYGADDNGPIFLWQLNHGASEAQRDESLSSDAILSLLAEADPDFKYGSLNSGLVFQVDTFDGKSWHQSNQDFWMSFWVFNGMEQIWSLPCAETVSQQQIFPGDWVGINADVENSWPGAIPYYEEWMQYDEELVSCDME